MQNWPRKLRAPEHAALGVLKVYRLLANPIKISLGLQGCCRFSPSCSHYVQQAIQAHGLASGARLGAKRLLRCHPWGAHGYDPVPTALAGSPPNEPLGG
jgi:putative membrane protein insertion efficiency factor